MLSISMILTATAIYAFGQTIDSVNQGNVSDSSSERTEIASDGYGKSFSRCGELLVIPQVKMNRKGAKSAEGKS